MKETSLCLNRQLGAWVEKYLMAYSLSYSIISRDFVPYGISLLL